MGAIESYIIYNPTTTTRVISQKGKVNMETLMKELSILLEEKNRRIESLEWQLEVANQRIKELKEEKKEIKQ